MSAAGPAVLPQQYLQLWFRFPIRRERVRLLARIADALEERVKEPARAIALETGNALRTQARPEAKTRGPG
jgi:acyl-CoA reductase-like NAD-dependent aldehyde dehydrogenase